LPGQVFHQRARGIPWKWWVCGLLFLATVINYMDRQALSQTAKQIKDELHLTDTQYGQLEAAFGYAFALGGLLNGWTADRWNVRWIYALALLGWSTAGLMTGMVQTFWPLVACRFTLGLFESGHWSCALRTTQRILPPAERTLGNSILQSGASVGAVLTPVIVQLLVKDTGTWNRPFIVIGATGTVWIVLWLASIRPNDLALEAAGAAPPVQFTGHYDSTRDSLWRVFGDRRFWVCLIVVVNINLTWQFFRAWMPLFLIEGRGYSPSQCNYFTMAYYIATGLGSLAAGWATIFLAHVRLSIHASRVVVYLTCALLTTLSLIVAALPRGHLLELCMLLFGIGSLGVFPVYYSLTQEMTFRHQGKVTGILSFATWSCYAVTQPLIGAWVDRTKSYDLAVAVSGLLPLVGFMAILGFWRSRRDPAALKSV
jgi:ACS family hexuronate transporter-like MFS transporter